MPGYQSFMGYDLASDVTLVIWTNLTLALDGQATANTLMVKILDEIYTVSPLSRGEVRLSARFNTTARARLPTHPAFRI